MAGGVHGRGGMHGRGACMAGGHVWQGACMAGGMCGRGHAWHTHTPHQILRDTVIRSMSGRYASYWNAFLFSPIFSE